MQQVERIKKLLVNLPLRDRFLCYEFLDKRDFESIKEIVDSIIFKIKRSLRSESPKEEYLAIDLDSLYVLKSEVDVYLTQLELPNINNNEEEY